jgi:glycosyltransferase involved in cell wall biosynthesis
MSELKPSVAFFSIGIPDPTQGGSGIFNYYVINELLDSGYQVDAFLRVNEDFIKKHTIDGYLQQLVSKGLNVELIPEPTMIGKCLFGFKLLAAAHHLKLCEQIVGEVFNRGKKYSAVIAHDLGWAMALGGVQLPVMGIIGDPLHSRLIHGQTFQLNKFRSWLTYFRAKSIATKSVFQKIAQKTNNKIMLGSLSPHHAAEFRDKGVLCLDVKWFSPEVDEKKIKFHQHLNSDNQVFRLLHVGTLESTASNAMLRYWSESILPTLASLPFPVEIRFVGRFRENFSPPKGNLKLSFLGHVADVEAEFLKCDAFFSPMKYPVGTRTRILSAISYGVPVIADPSVSFGLPELVDKRHIFFGRTAEEISELITLIKRNPDISRTVGVSARKLWES